MNTLTTSLAKRKFPLHAVEVIGEALQWATSIDLFAILEQMPQRKYLGEMELMVLLAVVRLGEEAYGVPISKELLRLAGREVALGSIYAALERLEKKAFVTSLLGDPTPERGGRAKRYFRVTAAGLRALKLTRSALINLWSGIPQLEGRRT